MTSIYLAGRGFDLENLCKSLLYKEDSMTLTNYALKNSHLTKVDLDNNSVIWRKLVDPSKAELSFISKKNGNQ